MSEATGTDDHGAVVISAEEFEARRNAREWRRWSLLKELLAANDAEVPAIVRELAEADRPRRRPGRA